MNTAMLLIPTVAVSILVAAPVQAITVTQNNNATDLANEIIGPGITLVGTPTLTGDARQSGIFTGGGPADVNLPAGVVLSTGIVSQILGANTTFSFSETLGDGTGRTHELSTNFGGAGDARLDTIIFPYHTYDASVLTFQFMINGGGGGSVGVNYVFGSEEYINFINYPFNDVFGFFLDGNNIALTPGTDAPVTVNTINPLVNSAYYINNVPNTNGYLVADKAVQFDGLTTVLTGEALNLGPGVHTMTFAIADAGDGLLDSGVFIQADSFELLIPEPATLALLGLGLAGMGLVRRREFSL
jgi:hypothetical protein